MKLIYRAKLIVGITLAVLGYVKSNSWLFAIGVVIMQTQLTMLMLKNGEL